MYSATADIVQCTRIARDCTVPVQIVSRVRVLPGIAQCQCRYCTLFCNESILDTAYFRQSLFTQTCTGFTRHLKLLLHILYTVHVLPGIVQCKVLYSASADILHCSGIARYSTVPVQIMYTVNVSPGTLQSQCRYCLLYRYCQALYSSSADILH